MKKVLYVILALVVLYLVLCIAGPSQVVVQRSATISAPADVIKSRISDFGTFKEWSPWQEKDPTMKTTVEGQAGQPGHKYSWEGNKEVGKGTMEITSINADSMVEKLGFDGRYSDVVFTYKPEGPLTNVNWKMNMNVPFIGRGMMMFFKGKMDKMLGGDFEKGLSNLKTIAEKAPVASATNYEVKEMNWDAKTYYGKKATLGFDKLYSFFGENFPKLSEDLAKNKIEMMSAPSGIYFKWDDATKTTDCAAAISVKPGTVLKGWEKFDVPACKVLQIEYFGAYDKSVNAHMAMDKYMKEKGMAQTMVIEEYLNDPMKEKDTAKWQTNIYYLLK